MSFHHPRLEVKSLKGTPIIIPFILSLCFVSALMDDRMMQLPATGSQKERKPAVP